MRTAQDYEAQAIQQVEGMVSHFATCRDANKF